MKKVNRKDFEQEYKKLSDKYEALEEDYNKLIIDINKNKKISCWVLITLIFINVVYLNANKENISLYNMILFDVPILVEIVSTDVKSNKIKIAKYILIIIEAISIILLFSLIITNSLIDMGYCFKFTENATMLANVIIEKKYILCILIAKILFPILIVITLYTHKKNEINNFILKDEVLNAEGGK